MHTKTFSHEIFSLKLSFLRFFAVSVVKGYIYLKECRQCLELILEVANSLTVHDVAANTFLQRDNPYVGADSAGRGRDDPRPDNLYEEADNFEKLHDVLLNDNLCVEADTFEKLHGALQHDSLYEGKGNFEKLHDAPPHNLCVEEDTSEKLHDVLQHDNLYVVEDNSGKHHDNQEVWETLTHDSWVALEASRHGSLEV